MNVFDYHEYEEFGQFHTELESFFEFLRYSGDRAVLEEKLKKHREKYDRLSSQAKALLMELSNIKELPEIEEERLRKGEFSMCKAFLDMKEEGREEGRAEGIVETGYECSLSNEDILDRLQKKLNIPLEKAQSYLAMYLKKSGVREGI